MGFFKEFKEFAMRGNVMDLAVGVIIGGAFGGIVNSMVKDIIMPVVGIAGKADFSNLYVGLTPHTQELITGAATTTAGGKVTYPSLDRARELGPVLAYGSFLTVLINFIILALCIFLMIKGMNLLNRKQATAPPPPAPPTKEEILLTEIRDAIRSRA
jgi:large conductance mechanosensitive channel